jgi:hypothetical protein
MIPQQKKPRVLDLHKELDRIEHTNPVADLADELIAQNWTEEKLLTVLGPRIASPVGNQLYNAYRDIRRGHCVKTIYHLDWNPVQ